MKRIFGLILFGLLLSAFSQPAFANDKGSKYDSWLTAGYGIYFPIDPLDWPTGPRKPFLMLALL